MPPPGNWEQKVYIFGPGHMTKTGWPRTLENRENSEKNSLQGKIREFEILLKIREKTGKVKKSYLCQVKIFKFYSCSDVATGGFCLPYA